MKRTILNKNDKINKLRYSTRNDHMNSKLYKNKNSSLI